MRKRIKLTNFKDLDSKLLRRFTELNLVLTIDFSHVLQQPPLPTDPSGLLALPRELVRRESRLELPRRVKKLHDHGHDLYWLILDLHLVRFSQLRQSDEQYDVLHVRSFEQATHCHIWLYLLRCASDSTKCERNLRGLCEWSRIHDLKDLAEKEREWRPAERNSAD